MSRNHRRPLPKHNILNFVPTYPGNEADDVELIECFGDEQNRISVRMHRKQKIHEGDRSHRHLVELDAAKFNYAGYDADEEKFTNIHCENDRDCDEVLEKMYFSLLQKQTISKKMEDKFNYPVSYPGWEADAEDYLRYQESNTHIAARLSERIERKQQLFMGDRSHPAIEELDRLKCDYPGFPFDRKNYEALHCENTTFSEAALEKAVPTDDAAGDAVQRQPTPRAARGDGRKRIHVSVLSAGRGGAGAAVWGREPADQRENGYDGAEAVVVAELEGDVDVWCARVDSDGLELLAGCKDLYSPCVDCYK
eukprot:CAMPEP_0194338372 /NCGR_PEP_ID=MMETSP0171-20130528/79355_1 /TAXON_ID=218684 /ORGANISM="Corethron pennatum, Strain L29A3" /LENGTH=308 /DNA_ID=CAMNT_0039102471 /DNA_START=262 /DNA_END=1187 /DNA_ORIENTATION=-